MPHMETWDSRTNNLSLVNRLINDDAIYTSGYVLWAKIFPVIFIWSDPVAETQEILKV